MIEMSWRTLDSSFCRETCFVKGHFEVLIQVEVLFDGDVYGRLHVFEYEGCTTL